MDGILSRKLSRYVNLLNSVRLLAIRAFLILRAVERLSHPWRNLGLVLIVAGLIGAVHASGEQNA